MFILLTLGLLVMGMIIALIFGTVGNFSSYLPDTENSELTELLIQCNSKKMIYDTTMTELSRKNYCCENTDFNNDGQISETEYCARLINGAINTCSQPIDYYTTYDNCKI